MLNAWQLEPPALLRGLRVPLVEKAVRCDDGGGFERLVYWVRVNDGWMRPHEIMGRGIVGVGGISAELDDEEDPYGEASNTRLDLAPSVWWRREYIILAPVGTRFHKRYSRPNVERARANPFLMSVPYDHEETDLVLNREGRLVPPRVLEEERQQRSARTAEKVVPLSAADVQRNVSAILAALAKD